MTTPEQFEQKLQQQYQQDKARHVLPKPVKRTILRRAKAAKQRDGLGLWRNTQLALSCALLVLMGYLLYPGAVSTPQHYQIVVSHDPHFKEVQQHRLSPHQQNTFSATATLPAEAYQQYMATQQRSAEFHYYTGMLKQHADQWQITVCDDLLLTIDRQLLSQLNLPKFKPGDFAQQQWVEFVSNAAGQLVAIKPVNHAGYCAGS